MSKLPETDSSLVRYLRSQKRSALRQDQSSAFTRSGISVDGVDAASVGGVTLAEQVADLAAQIADLASRVTVTTTILTFDTGALPNDSTWHSYGADIPITIAVPTGRLVVAIGCGEASLTCGGGSVTAEATFSISGGVAAYGSFVSRAFLATALVVRTSNSLSVQRAFTVTPGTYTITGKMRAWASGSATASVQFIQPWLTAR